MEKMKSALEIALEKTKKLEESSTKEFKEAEQQKYVKAAIALGRSLLQGKTSKEAIKESIMRYPEESREAALKAFYEEITGAMDLTNTPLVLQAITFLTDDAETRRACNEAEKLFRQYILKIKEKSGELQENIGRAMLKKLDREGIRGSALAGVNIKHLGQWKEAAAQLREEYRKILQNFRGVIISGK